MVYYSTIDKLLREILERIMREPQFDSFRLVGGTALSLQLGHRMSVDIDLFSDAPYGSINFASIQEYFLKNFLYSDMHDQSIDTIGKTYFVGNDASYNVKVDIFYTDTFIQNYLYFNGLRLATIEEIAAMKIDVVQRGGRKKDFWDIHALLEKMTLPKMVELHKLRYPYNHDYNRIKSNLIDFHAAENDFTPICLLGKHWEFIKEDIEEACSTLK
jgi:predicted nucleotidyltransferase component of viral defense system